VQNAWAALCAANEKSSQFPKVDLVVFTTRSTQFLRNPDETNVRRRRRCARQPAKKFSRISFARTHYFF
jgi:hypothetical protein